MSPRTIPKIKSVTRVYRRPRQARFRFFGNVEVGGDPNVEDFEQHPPRDHLHLGAEADRELGIPGEDLPGSYAATAFVGWYKRPPDYADRNFKLDQAKRAVVIGNGNVALDVARMLAPRCRRAAKDRHRRPCDRVARRIDDRGNRRSAGAARPRLPAHQPPRSRELGEL